MKKTLLGVIVFAFVFSGCALTVRNVAWPQAQEQPAWYIPGYIYSLEEAVSILKGMSAGASINGVNISSVETDKFSFRAALKWQEIYENKEYVPSYGGFFIGWDYVPTYGGSYQTNTTTLNKEENISVDFKDISDITINGRVLYISGLKMAVITCNSRAEAKKYADAFYSMLRLNGLKLNASYGFSFNAMSVEQENEIKRKGMVAASVFAGGPAEKAGLKPGDIIYEANGVPVKVAGDLAKALKSEKGTTKTEEIKVLHWEKTAGPPQEINWEKRLLMIKPVAR